MRDLILPHPTWMLRCTRKMAGNARTCVHCTLVQAVGEWLQGEKIC
jgi:hypothetical protein